VLRASHAAGTRSIGMEPISRRMLAHEVSLIAGAMLLYFGVRNLTAGGADIAFSNAERLSRFEQWAHLDWERGLQAAVIDSEMLVNFTNWVYIWGHWPVILPTALALFLWRRERYYLLRDAFFVSGAIGFLFFALLPVAPPRLLDVGLVDTVTSQSSSYRALQPPGLTNQYAAFPSLHVGWNVLLGIVVFTATRSRVLRFLSVAGPLAMAFSVVATANHFVVDVGAGIAVVLIGLIVATSAARPRAAIVAELAGDEKHPHGPPPLRDRAPIRQRPRSAARRGASRHPVRRG
jgi:PAP2 superfamily